DAKKHLADLILKVLRLHDDHPETRLRDLVTEIRLLFERRLYDFALKRVRRAKAIARREERHAETMQLILLETWSNFRSGMRLRDFLAQNRILAAEYAAARKALDRLADFEALYFFRMHPYIRSTQARDVAEAPRAADLLFHPLLDRKQAPKSVRARDYYHMCWSILNYEAPEAEQAAAVHRELKAHCDLMSESGFLIRERTATYAMNLLRLGSTHLDLGQAEAGVAALRTTQNIRFHVIADRLQVQGVYFRGILDYVMLTGDVDEFRAFLPVFERDFPRLERFLHASTTASVLFMMGICHWYAGDLKQATTLLRELPEVGEGSAWQLVTTAARMTQLAIYADREAWDLLEHYARTWRRSHARKQPALAMEAEYTRAMYALVDLPDRQDRRNQLAEILAYMQSVMDSGDLGLNSAYFTPLMDWLTAMTTGRELLAVVRENWERKARGAG
ncbi:MAG: hypothetical protein AAF570_09595, partial [Bacteroidota bacterium]